MKVRFDVLRVCAVFLAAVGVVACSGMSSQATLNSSDSEVRRLAQERWDAVLAKDYQRAYRFLSLGSKAKLTFEQYKAGVPVDFWLEARVESVSCDTERCAVTVGIRYRHRDGVYSRPIPERWVREQEGWAYAVQ